MRAGLKDLWRKITLKRHTSELRALRLARFFWVFAGFPIFLTIGFWWFALNLPFILIATPTIMLMNSDMHAQRIVGWAMFVPVSFYSIIVLVAAAPWFFRWYFIAVGLMFGRTTMADRKEAELIAAIAPGSPE